MVNPQIDDFDWGQFQTPEDLNSEQKLDNIEEVSNSNEFPMQDEESSDDIQWGQFQTPDTYQGEPDPTEEESGIGYFIRNLTANASRLGEQVIGKYGNAEKMGKDIIANSPKTAGLLGWAISELIGPERWERIVKGKPGRQQILPTSENIKELSQNITSGYTKPKTEREKEFQNITEDIGATLSLRRGIPNIENLAFNSFGIPVVSNIIKKTVKDIGFSEDKANYAKLGTWMTLSLLGNVNASQYASDLMNRGRQIPQNVHIDVPRMQHRINQLLNDPHLLPSDPRTALARRQLALLQENLANGQTSVPSMMTAYDGVNAAKRSAGMFELGRNDRAFATRAINRVNQAVREEIRASAVQNYPDAIHSWENGVQAWAVIHQSRAVTQYVESLARGPYAKFLAGPAAGLFGITSFGAYKAPLIAIPTSAATPALYKSSQVLYRIMNDRNLSQYYWEALSAAASQNAPAFISNYNKLNKGLEKSPRSTKNKKSNRD